MGVIADDRLLRRHRSERELEDVLGISDAPLCLRDFWQEGHGFNPKRREMALIVIYICSNCAEFIKRKQ